MNATEPTQYISAEDLAGEFTRRTILPGTLGDGTGRVLFNCPYRGLIVLYEGPIEKVDERLEELRRLFLRRVYSFLCPLQNHHYRGLKMNRATLEKPTP